MKKQPSLSGADPRQNVSGNYVFCNDLKNGAMIILYAVCNNNGCMMYRQIAHERHSPEELTTTGQTVKKTEKRKEASTWHG